LSDPGRSNLRTGLRWSVTALALGCLCTGLWALLLAGLSTQLAIWAATNLAESPELRSGIALLVLGVVQALVCLIALGLLALFFEIATPVGFAAGAFAGMLPPIVMLFAQGAESLSPATVLIARILGVVLSALAGGFAARRVRAFLEERVAPDDADDAAAKASAEAGNSDAAKAPNS
jgi:hypothetical protein